MGYNFSEDDKVASNWFKFETIGDRIQGTYIGKREMLNQLSGNNQTVYELKTENGEIWNVGGKVGIDSQMTHVKFGQIIEFRFIEERKSKKPGMNAARIIQVFAKKELVDKDWLLEQEAGMGQGYSGSSGGYQGELAVEEASFTSAPAVAVQATGYQQPAPVMPTSDAFGAPVYHAHPKLNEIITLANKKLGVPVTEQMQIKTRVMEVTGLAFIDANYDVIIDKLRVM